MPVRKPSGQRVYTAQTVEHMRRVVRLLAQGHRPAEILPLSIPELDALITLGGAPTRMPPAAGDSAPAESVATLLRATRDLDREAVLHELRTAWVRFGPLRALEEVAGPFMEQLGRAWRDGSLEVRHEHFASACLSDFLRGVREPFDQRARGPWVVAAVLPGDAHEGGLLMAAALMAMRGVRVLYLGADTPVEQIVASARAANAEAVAVSASSGTRRGRAEHAIAALRAALPKRIRLWIGGAGAPPATTGVERLESLTALDARLAVAT
jgi:methanogenic corrinoid protein MtbC1